MVQAMLASTLYKALKCSRSHEKTPRVSTGFQPLDEALHGGIKAGAITAISGERGTGKTLVCHDSPRFLSYKSRFWRAKAGFSRL